jgi:hypothetical protein
VAVLVGTLPAADQVCAVLAFEVCVFARRVVVAPPTRLALRVELRPTNVQSHYGRLAALRLRLLRVVHAANLVDLRAADLHTDGRACSLRARWWSAHVLGGTKHTPRTHPTLCHKLLLKLATVAEEQGKDVKQRSANGHGFIMPCSASYP